MKNAIILALVAIIASLGFGQQRRTEAAIQDTTLRHRADFPACITIRPDPLLRTPRHRMDFTPGQPFNDRGTA